MLKLWSQVSSASMIKPEFFGDVDLAKLEESDMTYD